MTALLTPPVLLAMTVKVAAGAGAVGVPVMIPVAGSKERPAGRDGVMLQLSAGPPVLVGTMLLIAVPRTKVCAVGL